MLLYSGMDTRMAQTIILKGLLTVRDFLSNDSMWVKSWDRTELLRLRSNAVESLTNNTYVAMKALCIPRGPVSNLFLF